jgi:hypothetical protein
MKRRWYQFSLRSLLIGVTLLALAFGYVASQARIVVDRNAVLNIRVKHAYTIQPVFNPTYRVNGLLRHWLSDYPIAEFCFDDNATDEEIGEARRAFPEAAIWSGEPAHQIERGTPGTWY